MMVSIVAGETFTARICAAGTGVIAYFRGPSSHDVNAIAVGNDWEISADTSGWEHGEYRWQAWVTLGGGEKKAVADYPLTVRASLVETEAKIQKTRAMDVVEKLEAMMAGGNIAEGVKRYRINNRELENYSVAELLSLLKYWRGRRSEERRKELGNSSLGRRIAVHV